MRVLIAYATRHGATKGIAERIAERLGTHGIDADARPAGGIGDADRYDAFIVGAAAYMSHWLREATAFVERNREVLALRPTWLFSSGPIGTERVDKAGRDVLETTVPQEFARLETRIRPRGEMVFFGALDPQAKPIGIAEHLMRLVPAGRDALPKGDFREWDVIDAWADEVAVALREPAAAS